MNDGINKIDLVYSFIQEELQKKCIVMYPGDYWTIGQKWHADKSIQKYLIDYQKNKSLNLVQNSIVSEQILFDNCRSFLKKLKTGYPNKNKIIDSLKAFVYVTDYQKGFLLSGKYGLEEINQDYDLYDVALSSSALNYCFEQLWGGDTLNVNARFQQPNKGNYDKFRIFVKISSNLNRNEKFPISSLFTKIVNYFK